MYLIAMGFQLIIGSTVVLMNLAVFFFYTKVVGGTLTPAKAFTALMYFDIIRQPFISLPMHLVGLLQVRRRYLRLLCATAAPMPRGCCRSCLPSLSHAARVDVGVTAPSAPGPSFRDPRCGVPGRRRDAAAGRR